MQRYPRRRNIASRALQKAGDLRACTRKTRAPTPHSSRLAWARSSPSRERSAPKEGDTLQGSKGERALLQPWTGRKKVDRITQCGFRSKWSVSLRPETDATLDSGAK
ncbi:hypothetical protein MRX96_056285 [Rhipicephalus microplus]